MVSFSRQETPPLSRDALRLPPLPDLLNAVPFCSLDAYQTDLGLVFAFAGSTSGGLFVDALLQARMAPSTWEPENFVNDLFLSDFVRACFQAEIDGSTLVLTTQHLLRLLSLPPADEQALVFRRNILAELIGHPETRAQFEHIYRTLLRFRGLLEGTAAHGKWDQNRRQLDILRAFHDLICVMKSAFATSQSGLRRLAEFAGTIAISEPFQSLAELLRYDERLATVNFRLVIGGDGRVRQLELVSLKEHSENSFHASPMRRWLAKLELILRGYRLSEGEVMARYLDAIFEGVRPFLVPLVQLFGDLEFYLGAVGFWERTRRLGLPTCFPEFVRADQPREFRGLYNPLLLATSARPVPCDVVTERHDLTLLITGPNSGGKTRLLQAIGLSQLLAQSGLLVPAQSARMSLAPGLLVSLLQETRVDQTEGRLGVELIRIRSLFERLPPRAIVILDELCSGTNPSEGEEIVELVIRALTRLHPQAYITTHFLEFAARLARERQIADLRFLQVVLSPDARPTYQFAPGVAATSLAGVAAARLGVTGEQLMALVDSKLQQMSA